MRHNQLPARRLQLKSWPLLSGRFHGNFFRTTDDDAGTVFALVKVVLEPAVEDDLDLLYKNY